MECRTKMPPPAAADSVRGAAVIRARMVALVVVFLGMGLLLQTSLGLQASGTDRWVTKAMYAADAGAMLQIEMIQMGAIGPPGSFVLVDDPNLPGLLKGQFNVQIGDFCETQPVTPVFPNGVPSAFPESQPRHFALRSAAQRSVGGHTGVSRAAVDFVVSSFPFMEDEFIPVQLCY